VRPEQDVEGGLTQKGGAILARKAWKMLADLKKNWRIFKKAAPGSRFEAFYEARKESGRASGIVLLALGILLLAGGVVLLFIPGPGLLLIAFGGALIAQRSLWLARILDRMEPALRKLARKAKRFWKGASLPIRAAVVASAGILAVGAAYVGYLWFFKE